MKLSQAKDYLPIIQAAAEGKTIQFRGKSFPDWRDYEADDNLNFTDPLEEYRIKPEPKLRPWKPEEVPMPCILKNTVSGNRYAVLGVFEDGIIAVTRVSLCHCPFSDLVFSTQHSTDGGKTWKPCGVEE